MWPFTSSEESSESSSSYYPPPSITGCSSVNYTYHESQEQVWKEIQNAYDIAKGKPHDKFGRGYTAMQVPFRVVYEPTSSSSSSSSAANANTIYIGENVLMAAGNIEEGTQVWKDWHYGRFSRKNSKKFYRFMEQLPLKSQCLVLSLSHASYDGKYIEVTMDEGNYIQEAPSEEQVNLDVDCHAIRDIKAGERFYMDFTDFVGYEHDIEWFDDLKYNAFRDAKLRGAQSTVSSPAAWDKAAYYESPTPAISKPDHGYPSLMWPVLAICMALFAIKQATAASNMNRRGSARRDSDLMKGREGKLC